MNKILTDIFKKKNLKDNTIKTYIFYLTNIYNNLFDKDDFNIDDFNNYIVVIKFIDDYIKNDKSKLSYLSSLISLLKFIDKNNKSVKYYSEYMNNINDKINNLKKDFVKNDKENKYMIDYDKLKNVYNDVYDRYYKIFSINHKNINSYLFHNLQKLIILACYILNEPRRLKDYSEMKINNFNNNDNYYKNGFFFFNNYKTSKFYNTQTIKLNDELNNMIKKFINIKFYPDSDYLFNNIKGHKLSVQNLNIILNNIFNEFYNNNNNKGFSVNNLRKITASFKLKDLPNLIDEANKLSYNMGNSINELKKTYIKK